ncbi:MAG: hypothetical protein FJ386_10790 [Verrucomicrobia bacterium]|nr:hypothetical protein [Verrucomicrobiota bacterium]
MKFLMRLLTAALVLVAEAWAQPVRIEVDAPQAVFLSGETVQLLVRIKNASGRRLHFGDDPEWLRFSLSTQDRKQVPKLRALDVSSEFDLEPGFEGIRKVEVTPAYDLNATGFYTATATVRVRELGVELTSPVPFRFEVVRGLRLWEAEFGVPPRAGEAAAAPETRRFAIIQLRMADQIRLYYRLADASDQNPIRAVSLGTYVAFAAPEAQMDRYSNLHVLYQSYRRSFTHCIVTADGELIGRATYDFGNSRPILKLDERDRVVVSGGLRLVSTNDLPPYDPRMFPKPPPPQAPVTGPPTKDDEKKASTKKEPVGIKPKK